MTLGKNDVAAIRRRIKIAEVYNERELKDNFKRSLALFTGEHYENLKRPSERARIIVNYTLNAIETKVNSVAFRYPEFVVKPETMQGEGQESIIKAALRYSWKCGRIQEEMKRAWKDKEVYGTGVIYCGWLFTTDEMRLENGRSQTDADTVPDATPNPTDAWEMVPVATVRDDHFFAKRINPGSFFVSPECGDDIEKSDYCGYVEVRPLEEVKANPYYNNTRQLKGSVNNLQPWFDEKMRQDYSVPDPDGNNVPADIKRVKLYHYYEKRRKLHVVMCDEHEKPLLTESWTWQHERYPFRVRQNPGDTDKFWGIPSPLLIEHQQRELNEARSQLSDHRRRFVPKFQAAQGILNSKAKNALKSPDAGDVVEHTGSEPAPIVPIQMPPLQPEVYSTEQMVTTDIQTVLGMNAYELGHAPSKRTPTAEVNAIQSQGSSRAQNDQQMFESWCAEVAQDCIDWLKMYSSKTINLPIYDNAGNIQAWHPFTGADIAGDYDISVYVNSTTPPNDQDRLQQIGFFLQSLNPLLQMAIPAQQVGINILPLARQLLESLPEVRDVNEIFMSQAPGGMVAPPGMVPGSQPGMGGEQAIPGVSPELGGLPFGPVDERKAMGVNSLVAALQGGQANGSSGFGY